MATERIVKADRIARLRDLAMLTVMRHGSFEASGEARLLVLRESGLMIAFRTPFNPLPKMTEGMRFEAALRKKAAYREPYGIDIWQERLGKVLSVGWRGANRPVVDNYERGLWEETLAEIACHGESRDACPKCASATVSRARPVLGEPHGLQRNRKRA